MLLQTLWVISQPYVNSNWGYSPEMAIETVSLEGTFCDTVQAPSSAGDMKLN